MFGSQIVDVAIGLFLLYLVLSLASSSIVEMVFSLTRLRFRLLRSKLREMLGRKDADELLAHGTIVAFGRRPSYLPASAFAVALLDNLGSAASVVLPSLKAFRETLVELRGTGKTPGSGLVGKKKSGPGK